jgi:prepilin-type N-terminal cleavage/methylation domain-containing protein
MQKIKKIIPKIKKACLSARKGFTLIELVVVIAIIGIVSALMLTALSASRNSSELESSATEVITALREAQNYALTGREISVDCNLYRMSFNGSDYILKNTGTGAGTCTLLQDYKLKNGVTFVGSSNVDFEAPHAIKTGALSVGLTKGGKNYYVCINSAGVITKSPTLICP